MAKKIPASRPATPASRPESKPSPAPQPERTVTRNTPVPRPTAVAATRIISHEQIAKRAYEIFVSGKGGSQLDNWFRAERELKGL